MALAQLGNGTIKANGVMGPSTRRAIEALERANGLAVTGALGPVTLPGLKRAVEAAIR
jgi:peptidoglycan hydrolase-like protein with peptidoglycan-binding domain